MVALVMLGGSLVMTSGCASGPRSWVAKVIPSWGSDDAAKKKEELAKDDKAKAKAKAAADKAKESDKALAKKSATDKDAKSKAKEDEKVVENQSSKSKTYKPGDPRSQVANQKKVNSKDKDAASEDKDKEVASARKLSSTKDKVTKEDDDAIADRLSKPADKTAGGRGRGVMSADDPFGSVAKTDKPAARKSKAMDEDPFLEDRPAETKVAKNDVRVPTAKKTSEIRPTEDADSLDELDREIASMNQEKKAATKKTRTADADGSSDRMKSLLDDDKDAENVVAARKGKSQTVSHEEASGENPFAEFEGGAAESKPAAKKAVVKPAKAVKKDAGDDLLEDMFDEKPAATATKPAAKKAPKNDTRNLPRLDEEEGVKEEAAPAEEGELAEPAPKTSKKKPVATPRDQADDLMLQARLAVKKNQIDEACALMESAAELERDNELVYEEGEERPSALLKRLNQLRGGPAKRAAATKAEVKSAPAAVGAPPAAEALPSLSPNVQPIEDDRQGRNDPFKSEKKLASKTSESSGTRTAALEQEDLQQGGISRVSANHPVSLPPLPGEKTVATEEAGKTADRGAEEWVEEPKLAADGKCPAAACTEKCKEPGAQASVTDEAAVAAPSLKRRSNTAAVILTGISLVSLGLSGFIVWRHVQNKQMVQATARVGTQADKLHAHKS